MRGTRVSNRFAKALLDLAVEQGKLEAVKEDMALVAKACVDSKDLLLLMKSPIINSSKKQSILKEIFAGKVDNMTMMFIDLMIEKKRENYIAEIAFSFANQYRKHKNIIKAVVKTAHGVDDTLRAKLLTMVKAQANGEIELVEEVDKDLIGGFILRVGDNQVDASVQSSLNRLKNTFSENPYIKEY